MLDSVPLSAMQKQKYLGVTFDTNLNWYSHVASVCRSMSYYLTLINRHVKSLPSDIIKMLMEFWFFSLYLCFACMGTSYSPGLIVSHFTSPEWSGSYDMQFA